jgi:hypothetical protein
MSLNVARNTGTSGSGGAPPPAPEADEPDDPPEWTPRMVALWDQLTTTQRAMFHGPAWHESDNPQALVRVLVDVMHECQRHYRTDLDDLLSVRFPDGFGGGTDGEFHAQWAREHWDYLDKEQRKRAEADAAILNRLTCTYTAWDRDKLPPRPWVAPPYLMRGEITVIHGMGSAGKSLVIVDWALACVLHRNFGRLSPREALRVVVANFEDNATEQERRFSAALDYFNAHETDLHELYRVSMGPDSDATMFRVNDGQLETTPIWEALQAWCRKVKPDVVILDPLIAINAAPESDNQIMRRVMSVLKAELAMRFKCALVIVHHDAKSAGEDTANDQTNARGAGDIINAARFEAAIKGMTVTQAEAFGIEREERKNYFRVGSEDSKRNYSAPEAAEWFERQATVINGEAVVRCVPWQPPSGKLSDEQVTVLIAAIGKGTSAGPFSPQLSKNDRSLSPLLASLGVTGRNQQRSALLRLKDRHGVEECSYRRPGHGTNERKGLRTAAGLPCNYEWSEMEETDAI